MIDNTKTHNYLNKIVQYPHDLPIYITVNNLSMPSIRYKYLCKVLCIISEVSQYSPLYSVSKL